MTDETIGGDRPLSPQARWNKANPKQRWAHRALASALKAGLIERGPCEDCGAIHGQDGAVIHGHHHDYDKPLAVRWLCQADHRRHHARHRSTPRHSDHPHPRRD
jgi:hypothetical protein